MTKILTAIALSIALPAVAHAQAAPAPAPKMACCEKMTEKCECCEHMAGMDHKAHAMKGGADAHAGHDMSGAKTPPADQHNHNQ